MRAVELLRSTGKNPQFFIATKGRQIVGVAGVKAADWALKTHLLYLSAVAPEMRGKGVGRALLDARLEWIKRKFDSGRVLVLTARTANQRLPDTKNRPRRSGVSQTGVPQAGGGGL